MTVENVDAFGKGFRALMVGDDRKFRVTRDDGYEEEMEVIQYVTGLVGDYERKALEYMKGRVLDVGCGAGRVALWLQLRGHDVTGVDASPTAIEVCKWRGLRECLVMSVEELSFPPASFDTVLLLGNNLGLAGSVDRTREFYGKVHRITSDGGVLIGTGRDPYKTDNPAHLAYHERNRKLGRPPGHVRIQVQFGDEKTDWMNLLLMSPSELVEIARSAGWHLLKTIEGDGGNYAAVLKKRTDS
jgi:SAM-dependent methyltransferase